MAHIITLPTYTDSRGSLTVIEKVLPFEIKRVYYIYNANGLRGGHRHKKTVQALIALAGKCSVFVNDNTEKKTVILDNPQKCLILQPEDWHTMEGFSKNCILLVFASQHYDKNDYIDEPYI